jgi:hypothetical protein
MTPFQKILYVLEVSIVTKVRGGKEITDARPELFGLEPRSVSENFLLVPGFILFAAMTIVLYL